jgi:hypothetical protein
MAQKKSTKQTSDSPTRRKPGVATREGGRRLFPPDTVFYFTPRHLFGLFAMFERFGLLEEAVEILEGNGVEFRMAGARRVGAGSDLQIEVAPTAVRDSTRELQDLLRRHELAPRHDDVQKFLESGLDLHGAAVGCEFFKFTIDRPTLRRD